MYQMLSGSLPFEADSPTAMIFQHAYEQPKPLRDAAPQVPESLCTIVHRLLAKSPADRHQTADEVLADIRAFRAGQPLPSAGPSAAPAGAIRPKTVIVQAPVFADAALLSLESDLEPPVSWWQRLRAQIQNGGQQLRRRVLGMARNRAPDLVQRLQNTQQQVDGAVAEYERRQDSLQQLVAEAAEVLQELKRQAAEHRRAAAEAQRRAESATGDDDVRQAGAERAACQRAGDELDELIAQQERELEAMHVRLAQVNATLQKIRSQRDLLNARFQVAQAQIQLATGPAARPRGLVLTAVRIAVLVVASSLIVGAAAYYWPSKPKVDRESIVLPTAPVPPRTTIPVPPYPTPPAERPPLVPDIGGTSISPGSSTAEVAPLSSEYLVQKFPGLGWGATSLAFSPDGRHLAIGKMDAAVLLFEIESGRRLSAQTELRELSQITALCFAPDGRRLLSGGRGCVSLWDMATGRQTATISLGSILYVQTIAVSRDGTLLAAVPSAAGQTVYIFRLPH